MSSGYRQTLINQATKLDVADRVIFQDFVSKPQQLMQVCDCVTLASAQETFGLVLPEAMRSGVAVIGSNSGGVPEIIDHGVTGLLFESGNANDLYLQIEKLYIDPDFKKALAQQGKQSADERFNNDLHFEQLEQHLKSILG
jgi:glycosyltransferase involved in cell wall biosynthesis